MISAMPKERTEEFEPVPSAESLDKFPEISTTADWRTLMRRTREAKELKQHELGARVGVSQNVISKLETGEMRASKAVIPICNVLRIPPPMALFEDELDQRWHEVGRRLRSIDSSKFEGELVGIEAQIRFLLDQADRDRNT
jgi:transcriptional regulator with XRE-family HTH domain